MPRFEHYRDVKVIHEGARSRVVRAVIDGDGTAVLIKEPRASENPCALLDTYRREYALVRRLGGAPGVLRVLGLEDQDDVPQLVMEDFDGLTLREWLVGRSIALPVVLTVGLNLVKCLDAIHSARIIYKNLHPSHVLIQPGSLRVLLMDFEIACALGGGEPEPNPIDLQEGSLAYISPEQTGRLGRAIDYRTDYYSLGVVLYELLTGVPPFTADDPLEIIHAHVAKIPTPPHEVNPAVPEPLSAIVMKLLAKMAEQRYHSAWGIRWDLEECLRQWKQLGQVHPFPLAAKDVGDRLTLPQKLYGRETEIELLLQGFGRVCQGQREMVLISGTSGVGKTALVREVIKPMAREKGFFLSVKFDALQTHAPYTAFAAAISQLVRQVLTEHETRITFWKEQLLSALGQNAEFLTPFAPEIRFLLGEHASQESFSPTEIRHRIGNAFRAFFCTFAKQDHPLILALDDLQWADGSSLKLIQALMTDAGALSLYIIGTCRSELLDDHHPLQGMLTRLTEDGVIPKHLALLPLSTSQIGQMLGEGLQCPAERLADLAQLVETKTNGNPFFIREFVQSLSAEGLVRYDPAEMGWTWDLQSINQREITDNVVDLMAAKIQKQSEETQRILTLAACLGTRFDLEALAIVAECAVTEAYQKLAPAIDIGLVLPPDDDVQSMGYQSPLQPKGGETALRFAHDRIRQAAYSLLAEGERPAVHWKLGLLLQKHLTSEKQALRLFDIVDHFNRSGDRLSSQKDQIDLARLNLQAGRKAKSSAAFEPAWLYFNTGVQLMGEQGWVRDYQLTLMLTEEAAETGFLCGKFDEVYKLTQLVLERARSTLEKAKSYELCIEAQVAEHKLKEAVENGLTALRLLGLNLPRKPGKLHALKGLLQNKLALMGKNIDDLAVLPEMSDPYKRAQLRIMRSIATAVYMSHPKLMPVMLFRQVNHTLRYGHTEHSASIFGSYGIVLCGVLRDYEAGAKIGGLIERLLRTTPRNKHTSRAIFLLNTFIRHWKEPVRSTLEHYQMAYRLGLEGGDHEYAAMNATLLCNHSYHAGRELGATEDEMASQSEAIRRLKQDIPYTYNEIWRQTVLNLMGRGKAEVFRLIGTALDRRDAIARLTQAQNATGLYSIYYNELILASLFGKYQEALEAAAEAKRYEDSVRGFFGTTRTLCHEAIARLHRYQDASFVERQQIRRFARAATARFRCWARYAPMNHKHLYHLLVAERLGVLGSAAEAALHYDQAIRLASQYQFTNEEALALELAGLFYLTKGNLTAGRLFLENARLAYNRWGALAKVKDIEERFGGVLPKKPASTMTGSISQTHSERTVAGSLQQMLDIKSVLKASQSISSEIELSRVLQRLMEIVAESAGAERGFLILKKENGLFLEARVGLNEGSSRIDSLPVEQSQDISQGIVRYVLRTKANVVLSDAANEGSFLMDPHVASARPRSILCTPLMRQGEVSGILYLENNQTTAAFTPDRVELLSMLGSQAAISLDNAALYENLKHALEKAMESERMKTEFLCNTSHELRTPLNAIINIPKGICEEFTQVPVARCATCQAAFELEPGEKVESTASCPGCAEVGSLGATSMLRYDGDLQMILDGLQIVVRSGHSLLGIINDILQLSEIEQKQIALSLEDTTLAELCERAVSSVEEPARKKHIHIEVSTGADAGALIRVDDRKVVSILNHLLNNAIKFSDSSATVWLEARLQGQDALFGVRDKGIGIPREQHELIFAKFHQVDAGLTRKYGGAGLGLSIVKGFVEAHQGRIWVESEPGQGATFWFVLPDASTRQGKDT